MRPPRRRDERRRWPCRRAWSGSGSSSPQIGWSATGGAGGGWSFGSRTNRLADVRLTAARRPATSSWERWYAGVSTQGVTALQPNECRSASRLLASLAASSGSSGRVRPPARRPRTSRRRRRRRWAPAGRRRRAGRGARTAARPSRRWRPTSVAPPAAPVRSAGATGAPAGVAAALAGRPLGQVDLHGPVGLEHPAPHRHRRRARPGVRSRRTTQRSGSAAQRQPVAVRRDVAAGPAGGRRAAPTGGGRRPAARYPAVERRAGTRRPGRRAR